MYIEDTYWKDTYIAYTYMYIDFLCMYECMYICMHEFDLLCIHVFIHVRFIYDCNIWMYYQLTTLTDTYFRFLDENIDYMFKWCHINARLAFILTYLRTRHQIGVTG